MKTLHAPLPPSACFYAPKPGEKSVGEQVNDLLLENPGIKWNRPAFLAACKGVEIDEVTAHGLAVRLNPLSETSDILREIPISFQLKWLPLYLEAITGHTTLKNATKKV